MMQTPSYNKGIRSDVTTEALAGAGAAGLAGAVTYGVGAKIAHLCGAVVQDKSIAELAKQTDALQQTLEQMQSQASNLAQCMDGVHRANDAVVPIKNISDSLQKWLESNASFVVQPHHAILNHVEKLFDSETRLAIEQLFQRVTNHEQTAEEASKQLHSIILEATPRWQPDLSGINAVTEVQNQLTEGLNQLQQQAEKLSPALEAVTQETTTKMSGLARNCVIGASVVAAVGAAAWAVNRMQKHAAAQEAQFNARLAQTTEKIGHLERLQAERTESHEPALARF